MGKKKRRSKSRKGQRPKKSSVEKKLSPLLRQADGCLLNAFAFQSASQDIILVEGGHLLTRKTLTHLLLAKGVLQGTEDATPLTGDDVPVPTKISYNVLSESVQKCLAERGVPVLDERPFFFDYKLLALHLPREVRVNIFYNAFIELMLNEWKINYGRKLFVGFGFEEWGRGQLSPDEHQMLQDIAAQSGHQLVRTGINIRTARGLWFASECINRIRAQWDKLIDNLVFAAYFSERPSRRFEPTIDSLEAHREHAFVKTTLQKDALSALVCLARQTKRLRSWRDSDMHQFSQTVFGVLDKPKTDESLGTLWDMVLEEHNRVREGIIAMIGMVVLGPQVSSSWYAARWPSPTRYIDFNNPDDVAKHSQLAAMVKRQIELRQALQEAQTKEEKLAYINQIAETIGKINRLVGDLYYELSQSGREQV